ncbi:hypothetical protein [Puniceicoccus vermicola]|uniref:Uncharacterized protein n=1 Tax=Puniceicoccus vermicola TaxID=388746 RepID=A0A7X1AWQ1_9BACT|nr:hypothetical protein [Puniceicoccus vermicola]MBC2601381.1 hypothetical protein [Puniceicoccus vermicola]
MKSAYELAMERLEKDEPSTRELSDEQKQKLEEISQTYRAKVAEREVFLQGKIVAARASGNGAEVDALERELREEKRRLEEECEEKKNGVRQG